MSDVEEQKMRDAWGPRRPPGYQAVHGFTPGALRAPFALPSSRTKPSANTFGRTISPEFFRGFTVCSFAAAYFSRAYESSKAMHPPARSQHAPRP